MRSSLKFGLCVASRRNGRRASRHLGRSESPRLGLLLSTALLACVGNPPLLGTLGKANVCSPTPCLPTP